MSSLITIRILRRSRVMVLVGRLARRLEAANSSWYHPPPMLSWVLTSAAQCSCISHKVPPSVPSSQIKRSINLSKTRPLSNSNDQRLWRRRRKCRLWLQGEKSTLRTKVCGLSRQTRISHHPSTLLFFVRSLSMPSMAPRSACRRTMKNKLKRSRLSRPPAMPHYV